MRRANRRAAAAPRSRRRLFAAGAVITALGAAVGFTSISNAATNDTPEGSGAGKVVNGQVILTDTCVDSNLEPHDGFQKGDRCVSTEFGEVARAANNASLLITDSPEQVGVGQPFTLKVSTRNLIRDRFLAAGQGGYYVESSILQNGIVRGHFHTACRMLANTNEAPVPDPVPAFFVATEDKKGAQRPDEVTISVPGMPTEGTAQCASWAGDGSHRIPMMERANQTPAYDVVRIQVGGRQGGNDGGDQGGGDNNGGGNQGNGGNQGGDNGGGQQGGDQGGDNGGGQNNDGDQGGQQGGGDNGGQQGGNQGGGQQGGGNQGGGNQGGGENGGQQGGGNNGGGAAAPSVKNDFTPDPVKPANPKPAKTVASDSDEPKSDTSDADDQPATTTKKSTVEKTGGSDEAGTKSATKPEAKTDETDDSGTTEEPESTSTVPPAGDYVYDDGQFNSGSDKPVEDQIADAQASTKQADSTGPLALTGANTAATVGGAALLLLAGLGIMTLTRKRRPDENWR